MYPGAVVFDLDDTLYKEIDFVKSGFAACVRHLEEEGFRVSFSDFYDSFIEDRSRVFQNIISRLVLADPTKEAQLEAKLVDIYRFHLPNIQLDPSALQLIQELAARSVPMAIITDGRSRTQRNKLKALGLDQLITEVFISDEVGHAKPALWSFLAVQQKFAVNTYCYIANDTAKDFLAPNELGWYTVGLIDDGRNIHAQLPATAKFDELLGSNGFSLLPRYWLQELTDLALVLTQNGMSAL